MAEYERVLADLLRQEELLQLSDFTNDTAIEIGTQLIAAARAASLSITVDVSRNGQQLFHCALAGTNADNDAWVQRKNRVVTRFGHSSFYIGQFYASTGTTLEARALLDPREYAAHGGAFPATVKNVGVVGTITVSGLPQAEDHALVVRVLAEYLGVTLEV